MRQRFGKIGVLERVTQRSEQFHAGGFRFQFTKDARSPLGGWKAQPPGDIPLAGTGHVDRLSKRSADEALEICERETQRRVLLRKLQRLVAGVEKLQDSPLPALEFFRPGR